ncbi:hypothetical protein K438DRAFT_1784462 [Mycena galopus ATCC 62051]|nr:hypothetical protein K438DRAFT_1784462 [Mycena galopus ATCC 62051]
MSNPCRGTRGCCEERCNYVPDPSERNPLQVTRIGVSGYRIRVGVASREPERRNPTQGTLNRGLDWIQDRGCLRGTHTKSLRNPARELVWRSLPLGRSRSQGKGQRIGVLVLSSERGAKARPEQRDDKSTPGSSPRTK